MRLEGDNFWCERRDFKFKQVKKVWEIYDTSREPTQEDVKRNIMSENSTFIT